MDPRSLQRRVRRWIALQIFRLAATRPAAAALGHIPRSFLFSYLLELLYRQLATQTHALVHE